MTGKDIVFRARCKAAEREFFYYCKLKAPDFYRTDRQYIVDVCERLQAFYESDTKVMVINMPPRMGKSRTAQNLVEWILGKDQSQKIMTGSYNETLSMTFAKGVRNTIQEEKGDRFKAVYSDVFPDVRIQVGDASMNKWSLVGGYNNYLATSPGGTATGFGCSILIVDDIIKNAKEAYNERIKEEQWRWFTDTMLSRLEEGGKILIISTRWASDDLAGRVLNHFKELGIYVEHINYKAMNEDGSMLCPELLSAESYEVKKRTIGEDIFLANYQQEPIDLKGSLYSSFKTYEHIPLDSGGTPCFTAIKSYTDTADEGSDYLCSIAYGVYNGDAYVLDVLFTQEPMEITEPKQANMLIACGVKVVDVESNNGGKGFARNVQRLLKEAGAVTSVRWFHQSANKKARILSNATNVMEHLLFPIGWEYKYPEFHKAMIKYQREGNNEHDDAPDCATGVIEKMLERPRIKINPHILGGRR